MTSQNRIVTVFRLSRHAAVCVGLRRRRTRVAEPCTVGILRSASSHTSPSPKRSRVNAPLEGPRPALEGWRSIRIPVITHRSHRVPCPRFGRAVGLRQRPSRRCWVSFDVAKMAVEAAMKAGADYADARTGHRRDRVAHRPQPGDGGHRPLDVLGRRRARPGRRSLGVRGHLPAGRSRGRADGDARGRDREGGLAPPGHAGRRSRRSSRSSRPGAARWRRTRSRSRSRRRSPC